MLGLPEETVDEMMLTVKFLKKYKPDAISAKKFTPFPGTNIFDYCVKEGLLKEPRKIDEYAKFEISSSEPNVSLIPTNILMKTVNDLNKKDIFVDLKKTVRTLKAGHFKHFIIKAMKRLKNPI